MKQSYYWLVGVLITALLGILVLQARYTLDNYRLKTTEFQEEVDQLFAEAITTEAQIRKDSIVSWFRQYISDTTRIKLDVYYDAEEDQFVTHIRDLGDDSPYTSISFQKDKRKIDQPDSTNRRISIDLITETAENYLEKGSIYYWTLNVGEQMDSLAQQMQVDTNRLGDLYDRQLKVQRTYSPYQLIFIPIDSIVAVPSGKKVYTQAFPMTIMGAKKKILAQFPNPFTAIIRKVGLSIIGSLLIILLTAGSFFFMLRIILRQKQLAQIKDDFIDNISHELQTPLATLKAANEGLEKYHLGKDPQKARQYLHISRQQIERLSQMVDQTLWNSIYERKRIQIQTEQIDLKALIEDSLASLQLKYPGVSIHFEEQQTDLTIQLDPTHLKNCLDNLLDNAVKHNSGQADLRLELSIQKPDKDHLEILISDNGKGIPLTDQPRIFDKFYRVDDRQANGFGIGLYYVKSALQAMYGSIRLDSQPGQGAQFTLKIPLNHA
ncbi:MAG TPA: HAMP domain-containing sensor histidine kinase [Saprospiraceae bacterium]|nr:HAMP domain-containing sensor histidine kinase [Saprospiraceae bacterium]